MRYSRVYRLKRRNIILNERVEFNFFLQEFLWIIKMKIKGFKLKRRRQTLDTF